jgi:transposase
MTIPIEQLLNIPQIRVLHCEMDENKLRCDIESTLDHAICHKCGEQATEFYCSGETLVLRHLPICEREVYLHLRTKRYRCLQCDDHPTTTQQGDWYDAQSGSTKAFADFLLRALVNSTTSDVSIKHRVSYDVVRGLLSRYIKEEVDWSQFTDLRLLGLDEISLLKGHRDFVTIVSTRNDQGRPAVLAVLEGRAKETVVAFLQSIPEHLRATIEQVCTDLYDGYVNAAKAALPQAKVVADRFHVAKLYRAAVDELRKIEMRELKGILHPEEYAGLKGVMWVLRRNSGELTIEERQLLELLFQCSPLLRKAYAWREKLTRIFETNQTKESAERAIRQWMAKVKDSGLNCFDKFLQTLEERMEEITNYFISRLSSGWVEGLNNKIKVLKRRCYGISNPINLFRRLWLDIFGYEAFAH